MGIVLGCPHHLGFRLPSSVITYLGMAYGLRGRIERSALVVVADVSVAGVQQLTKTKVCRVSG